MKLTEINKLTLGQFVTAQPEEGKPWVTYSNSNEGEENYYRDVFSKVTGGLIYCFGESCKIEGYDEEKQKVTLSNDNIDDNDYPAIFIISYEQFKADFC